MRINKKIFGGVAVALAVGVLGASLAPTFADSTPRNWRAPMSDEDRAYLNAIVGEPLPEFTRELKLLNDEPMTRDDLYGNVVVIQSWSSDTAAGRKALPALVRNLSDIDSDDLVLMGLHTPNGAEDAREFASERGWDAPIIVDPVGEFSDALGVYKRPVNIVVDKHGRVRYAGLNKMGLESAVAELLAEDFDEEQIVEPTAVGEAEYPPHNENRLYAEKNLQGKPGPEVQVEHWMTDKPDMRGKVVMIDFWATWCPPCRASIPHANELAEEFEDEVVIVGISNEKLNDFKQGLEKYDLKLEEFEYALGVDPEARSAQYVGVQGIPHVVVMSSDGIVRWQGMPQNLTADTLRAIVRADNPKSVGKVNGKPGRWVEG